MSDHRSRFRGRPRTYFPHGPGEPRGPLTCDACRVAARTMLAALPARTRQLLTSPGAMVVIKAPSEAWVQPLWAHLHASLLGEDADTEAGWLDARTAAIVMRRIENWEPWQEVEDGLAAAEAAGRTVIAVSHLPADCLPPQLVAVAHHVVVAPLTEAGVRQVVRECTGQVVRDRVAGDLAGRLTPAIIAQACRRPAGASACLATMMTLTGAGPAGLGDDGHLQIELHQSGPAAAWARQAGARVLAWREHAPAKPKGEVALLVGPTGTIRLLAVALAAATGAEMVTVLPGDHEALLDVANRVRSRSGGVRRGTKPLLVYLDAVEFWGDFKSSEGIVLSGLLAGAVSGAAVVVGATDSLGGLDADMRRLWRPARPLQGRPGVKLPLHPDVRSAY